jgi:hypothetical protein
LKVVGVFVRFRAPLLKEGRINKLTGRMVLLTYRYSKAWLECV